MQDLSRYVEQNWRLTLNTKNSICSRCVWRPKNLYVKLNRQTCFTCLWLAVLHRPLNFNWLILWAKWNTNSWRDRNKLISWSVEPWETRQLGLCKLVSQPVNQFLPAVPGLCLETRKLTCHPPGSTPQGCSSQHATMTPSLLPLSATRHLVLVTQPRLGLPTAG